MSDETDTGMTRIERDVRMILLVTTASFIVGYMAFITFLLGMMW